MMFTDDELPSGTPLRALRDIRGQRCLGNINPGARPTLGFNASLIKKGEIVTFDKRDNTGYDGTFEAHVTKADGTQIAIMLGWTGLKKTDFEIAHAGVTA